MKKLLALTLLLILLLTGCAPAKDAQSKEKLRCTLSISCANLLNNAALSVEKRELLPEDGWLLKPVSVDFSEGESVFDLLCRVTRENKIHMEYVQTPAFNSAYIEGIGNLYEFDGGPQSGWMYSVNGEFPNYGCSSVLLKDGDTVEWSYTCDLGKDVGGGMDDEA